MNNDRLDDLSKTISADLTSDYNECAIFLSGSLVAGLGTSTSDVDIYVLGSPERRMEQRLYDGQRVDIEHRTLGWLADQVQSIRTFETSKSNLRPFVRPVADYDDLIRLTIARSLSGSLAPEIEILLRELRECSNNLIKFIVARQAGMVMGNHEDIEGFIIDDRADDAAEISRTLQANSIQAILVAAGYPYLNNKWIPSKLRIAGDRMAKVRDWYFLGERIPPTSDDQREVVMNRVNFGQYFSGVAQLISLSNDSSMRAEIGDELINRHPLLRRRNNFYISYVTDDANLLISNKLRSLGLPFNHYVAWLCAGLYQSSAQDIEYTATLLSAPHSQIAIVYRELADRGLIDAADTVS